MKIRATRSTSKHLQEAGKRETRGREARSAVRSAATP